MKRAIAASVSILLLAFASPVIAQGKPEKERLTGTIATNVLAFERGASIFRVHDVAEVRDALIVAAATVIPTR